MKLVWIYEDRQYVRTQGEAKATKKTWEVQEVPTDQPGLMAMLNKLHARIAELEAGAPQLGAADDFEANPEAYDAKAAEMVHEDPAPPPPPAAKPLPDIAEIKRKLAQDLRGMQTEVIEEKIVDAKAPELGRYLHAAVCRLGELGRAGYEAFVGYRTFGGDVEAPVGGKKQRNFIPGADERGLRYLALMQVDDILGRQRAPADTVDA